MSVRSHRRQLLLLAALALSGATAFAVTPAGLPAVLVMGTYPSELPSEELEKLEPVREGLERRLVALGLPVKIDIQIFAGYEEAMAGVAQNKVDFARLGPASYVIVKKQNSGLKLLGVETANGSKWLTGYISVPERSTARRLQDLRGARIAFGEQNSTTGRYYPQAALVDAGLTASDLGGYRYLGRHDRALGAAANGSFDAAATNEVAFAKYGLPRKFRILHTMKSPAHAWVARPDLPPVVIEKLRQAMFDLKPQEMAALARDGIAPGGDADFEPVRAAIRKAERFGN